MSQNNMQQGMGAIETMEEAVHLLRQSPVNVLGSYYIGSLPFFLALLYFCGDMSRNAFAAEHCTSASLGVAVLFVWMKCWHVVFARKVQAQIHRNPLPRWSLRRIVHLVVNQTLIHFTGLLVLPIAFLMAIPFGWTYAFYQNVSALDESENDVIKTVFSKSWKQAQYMSGQNHVLIFIFFIFGTSVFLNLASVIFLIPYMLKSFLGIETMFTMSGRWVLNTTFLATALSMTYLCMDPLIKATYTLRCFYGASIRTGEDIKAEMKRFIPYGKALTAILLVFSALLFFPVNEKHAHALSPEYLIQNGEVSPEELNRSIEKTMERREFAWRMPREKPIKTETDHAGPIAKAIEWLVNFFKDIAHTIAKWVKAVIEWLNNLWPETDQTSESTETNWMDSARNLVYVLLTILVGILVVLFWRTWQRRRTRQVDIVSEPVPSTPDLTDEEIDAGELPPNRWLTLAKEMMSEGSLQLAMRALYLATLAHLAECEIITIAKYKSNRDYEQELRRRIHEHKELIAHFSTNVRAFDKSWYGMYEVTREDLNHFIENQERIMAFGNT